MNSFANLWQRISAFLLDYLILTVYLAVLSAIFFVNPNASSLFDSRIKAQLFGFLLVTFPITLYFAISESSKKQGTWGKSRLSLKVTNREGNRIGFGKTLIRSTLKFVPWEISHTLIWEVTFNPDLSPIILNGLLIVIYGLLGANIASLLLTKTRQTLYDLVCGTYVIKK